jgi:hypothetical protein
MARRDHDLVVLLRLIGAAELAALLFVFVPTEWIGFIHDHVLGLGPFPDWPIAVYLARHLSALYAVHGALLMAISLDPRRYRPLARLLGWCHVGLGVALAWTDWSAGFHWVWAVAEGMLVGGCGGLVVWFSGEPCQRDPRERVVGRGEV